MDTCPYAQPSYCHTMRVPRVDGVDVPYFIDFLTLHWPVVGDYKVFQFLLDFTILEHKTLCGLYFYDTVVWVVWGCKV